MLLAAPAGAQEKDAYPTLLPTVGDRTSTHTTVLAARQVSLTVSIRFGSLISACEQRDLVGKPITATVTLPPQVALQGGAQPSATLTVPARKGPDGLPLEHLNVAWPVFVAAPGRIA